MIYRCCKFSTFLVSCKLFELLFLFFFFFFFFGREGGGGGGGGGEFLT